MIFQELSSNIPRGKNSADLPKRALKKRPTCDKMKETRETVRGARIRAASFPGAPSGVPDVFPFQSKNEKTIFSEEGHR